MQKKISQLTKVSCTLHVCIDGFQFVKQYVWLSSQVIKHLNTKGAEDTSNLPQAAGEYEVEIEQILQTTVAHVSAFNKQLALQQEESRIAVVVQVRLTA